MTTQRTPVLASVGAMESVAVVVHLYNTYRVDLPDLPTQMVFTVKKETPAQVSVKEF